MPKPKRIKMKYKKGKMDCPICDKPIRGSIVKIPTATVGRLYRCSTPRCGYVFDSESGYSEEHFGEIILRLDTGTKGHKPGMAEMVKDLKTYTKNRNQLIGEMRDILRDPHCVMMFECLESPNSNKIGISRAFVQWLSVRKKRFPYTLESMINKVKRYENQQKVEGPFLDEGEDQRSDSPYP